MELGLDGQQNNFFSSRDRKTVNQLLATLKLSVRFQLKHLLIRQSNLPNLFIASCDHLT